jgi:hypothetical protein
MSQTPIGENIYLLDHQGQEFCQSCLTKLSSSDGRGLTMRAGEIRGKEIKQDKGVCSSCGQAAKTLTIE